LDRDLWHGWSLTRVYDRTGIRLGRASLETALTGLAATTKRRRRRGYELTN
jgi:hypothetical protein